MALLLQRAERGVQLFQPLQQPGVVGGTDDQVLSRAGALQQLLDLLPSAILTALMLLAVVPAGMLRLSSAKLLAIQVAAGVAVYLAGSGLLRPKAFRQLWQFGKQLLRKMTSGNRMNG